jgi:N-acetylglucosamine-6-phosphate deacetylase
VDPVATLTGGQIIGTGRTATIVVQDGLITSVGADETDDQGDVVIDVTGLTVAPGLLDLQINGGYGSDFTSDPGSIWLIGARLPEQGVTSFLPTIITSPPAAIAAARTALAARPTGYQGAEPLGLHLEGPMLSAHRPGIHDPSLMRSPSLDLIEGWSSAAGVAMVTLAPELPGSQGVIKALTHSGVVVSAGHTAATLEEAEAGFGWGVTAVTHLFNAMERFDHRAPGLIGAVVRHPRAIAGLIADGLHSDPAVVFAAWKLLGPTRLALVTDAMAATGLGDGDYNLGSVEVNVNQGRVTDKNGRLAGSTLTMDQAVRNLADYAGCSPAEALASASSVPAGLLGLKDRGQVAVGNRADLVLLDDALEVVATMVDGKFVFTRAGWAA